MRAAFFREKGQPLVIKEIEKPTAIKDQVIIKLHHAALNHRDIWICKEQATSFPDGIILGSDGSGVIEGVSEEGDIELVGREVVVNPSLGWGNNPFVQSSGFSILGFPQHGTFGDYLVISKKQVFEKPPHLTLAEAAAIPLSGLTAYRALFSKARLRPGEKILITGIGGGAALMAFQFALAFKAKVYVTSSSNEKLEMARKLGALDGFNYRETNWLSQVQKVAGGFDVIIDSAGGKQFNQLMELAYPGGRLVLFGRTDGMIPEVSPRTLYWKQLNILGSTMGTQDEFLSMLDFMEKNNLRPVIDSDFRLEEVNEAMKKMESGEQFGKIVLNISTQ